MGSGTKKLLTGEHGGDALRNTLATIIPGIVVACLVKLDVAVVVSIGALLASLTDMPGSRADKWLSAKWCIPAFFIVALTTAASLHYAWILVPWLMVAAFAGGMLFALGPRVAIVGILSLIVACFTIGLWPVDPLFYSCWFISGAGWYFFISMLLAYYAPYRSLKHALKRSVSGIAALLKAKALFYDANTTVEKAYEELSALHVIVSEQQDQVRLLLLRERDLLKRENEKGQQWLNQLYAMIDLHEVLTAIDHDYDTIREALIKTGALELVQKIVLLLADRVQMIFERDDTGSAKANKLEIQRLAAELNELSDTAPDASGAVLSATIANLREILDQVDSMGYSIDVDAKSAGQSEAIDYKHFIPASSLNWKVIAGHFSWKSDVLRFAIRWALLFGAGGLVGFLLPDFRYTYWVLLTIAIVARPTFAVTQRRNFQRMKGTVLGLLICLPLIYLLHNTWLLLIIATFSLYGFFLFNQPNYTISVLFITITAMVLLNMHQGAFPELLGSRAGFTLLGAALAILGWFLLPVKQSRQLSKLKHDIIQTNQDYLTVIVSCLNNESVNNQDIRLARKKAHTALASFSDTLNQLRNEPGSNRRDWTRESQYQSIAYRANSLIVGIALSVTGGRSGTHALPQIQPRIDYVQSLFSELEQLK
ncbi:FUSC family membrane protein [Niabella sp. CJ426]|uniref:FUSC family protein n=1 Tax=Niabella sp. CJ426 TaxID=3393740 RepID=UPI003D00A299